MKFYLQYIKLVGINLALLGFMPGNAQPPQPVMLVQRPALNQSGRLSFVPPPPPSTIGIPGDRTGAGRRGCNFENNAAVDKQLTALVPLTGKATGSQVVLGLTTVEHPTFWFYVPYRAKSVQSAKFVLRTEDNKLVYQTAVTLPKTPGIVSLRLPSTKAPLTIGKQYHWYFNIYCAQKKPPISVVHGWVKRDVLNPALGSQLKKVPPRERVALYVANGIWHEALTTLAELHYAQPKNAAISQDWASMLHEVGLDAIATEPIDILPLEPISH